MHLLGPVALTLGLLIQGMSASPIADFEQPKARSDVTIESRATWWDGQRHCDWPPQYNVAHGVQIKREINAAYNNLNGKPGSLAVAARSCVRVACSWTLSVWVCNDLTSTNTQPWVDIAKYTKMIDNECGHWGANGDISYYVKGQFFDRKSYNVIVREDLSC